MRRVRAQAGQGSVELVAIAPVFLLVGLAFVQGLLGVRAQLAADRALARAHLAIAQGADPVDAARAGLPAGARLLRRDGSLDVYVRVGGPRVPGLPAEIVASTRLDP